MTSTSAGDLVVTVHTDKPPTEAEWQEYLTDIRALPDPARCCVLVYSEGGGPNTTQRAALSAVIGSKGALTAIVTPSVMMRGIGTAISWFNPRLKVFGPAQLEDAFEHLGLSPDLRSEARARLRRSAAHLGLSVPFAA